MFYKVLHPGRFGFHEINVHEGVGAETLEANHAIGVDNEKAMQGQVFKVIKGLKLLENAKVGVRENRHGEFDAIGVVFQLAGGFKPVGADGDNVGPCLLKVVKLFTKGLKLLHAVGTLAAKEENDDCITPGGLSV